MTHLNIAGAQQLEEILTAAVPFADASVSEYPVKTGGSYVLPHQGLSLFFFPQQAQYWLSVKLIIDKQKYCLDSLPFTSLECVDFGSQ